MTDEEIEALVVQAMPPRQVFDIAVQQSWSKDKLDQAVASMRNPEFETVDEFCKYLTETHVETQLNNFSEIWKK